MTGQAIAAIDGLIEQIAGYRLDKRIGAGGMAVVYRAVDERLDRRVALKVLAAGLTADRSFRIRFVRESRAAAAVDHPNIIPVYDAGESGGRLYIAMRYVRGGDARSLVRATGPLPAHRALSLVTQAARGLDAAHSRGLVHRDVKPANMLLDAGAGDSVHVYLADFGVSKQLLADGLTVTGQIVGTLTYTAPEQIEGLAVDGRADLYSLACTTFELLGGTPPFRQSLGPALIYAHLSEPPPALTARRPGLPPGVDAVIARAMAKDPGERHATCEQFAAELARALRPVRRQAAPGPALLPSGGQVRGTGIEPPTRRLDEE